MKSNNRKRYTRRKNILNKNKVEMVSNNRK